MTSSQVDISSVKLHSSHSKGPRRQFLSRIVFAQSPCHIAIKAFRNVLTIAMYRCTIITLLLDFNFEVLIFSQLVDNYASFTSRIQVHGKGPRNFNVQPTGEKGCWGEVICHKKVQQSFLNQGLDLPHPPHPPNQKFLDPPLLFTYFRLPFPTFDLILRSE